MTGALAASMMVVLECVTALLRCAMYNRPVTTNHKFDFTKQTDLL